MPQPYQMTLAQSAQEIRSGNLSPVDLARDLLERVSSLDPALQAWVTVDQEAVLGAAEDRERDLHNGTTLGPIHGAPIGLKDIFYTQGMKTTACSRIYADFVPGYDATSVAKIKASGGIVLGKAVTTEFATSDPSPTRNPWNPAHTPGGSSSGSAVAVATGMCSAALGSQTGGSTCRPAAYNGIVGLKATYGRISRYGVIPVSWSLDTVGILTRDVQDAAIMLQVLSGHDPNDPGSSPAAAPDFLSQVDAFEGPPRIGLVGGFFRQHATEEVWEHTREIAERLAQAGASVVELELPASFSTAHSCQRIVMNAECAAFHQETFRERADDYGPRIRAGIEMGMLIPGADYLQAQRLRRVFRRDMVECLAGVDVALTPAVPAPAPRDLSTTGDAAFQSPWTSSGLPTVVVPSGLNQEGLPLAVQLAAAPWEEGRLLGAARWCENVLGVHLTPPNFT